MYNDSTQCHVCNILISSLTMSLVHKLSFRCVGLLVRVVLYGSTFKINIDITLL